jgi:hypothetical protein
MPLAGLSTTITASAALQGRDRLAKQTERAGRIEQINGGVIPGTAEKTGADGTAVMDFFWLKIRGGRALHHRTESRYAAGGQEDRFGQ